MSLEMTPIRTLQAADDDDSSTTATAAARLLAGQGF
jgi:hypothetical protein